MFCRVGTALIVAAVGLVALQPSRVASPMQASAPLLDLVAAQARLPTEVSRQTVQARARGLLVRDLGVARRTGQGAERLYISASDPTIREAALRLIVAQASWPQGFRERFLSSLLPAVLRSAREYHVPPSVTLAQAVLESGWGRSCLATRYRNLFGVKAGASRQRAFMHTREFRAGRLRADVQRYRVYESVDASIQHHARLLGRDRRYRRARQSWTDWRAFLVGIAPRYASDPRYVSRISGIVDLYRLDRWDALIVDAARHDDAVRPEWSPVVADNTAVSVPDAT